MGLCSDLKGTEKVKEYKNRAPQKPLVSVLVITYNQEKYIEQCIESILKQETDFEFEILIGEDDSTDNTRHICIEYAKKYPDKIRLFLHDRSNMIYIGGGPSGRYNMLYNFCKAKGKYIALCEGDDYWTDIHKLQKQVRFLEQNPNYSLCFHPVKVIVEDETHEDYLFPKETNKNLFTVERLLKRNFIQTNSVVYRRVNKYPSFKIDIMPGDWYLHTLHAKQGKIGFIKETMSVYRRHNQGLWWEALKNKKMIWKKHGVNQFSLFVEFIKLFKGDVKKENIIQQSMARLAGNLAETDKTLNTTLMEDVAKKFPSYAIDIALGYQTTLNKKMNEVKVLTQRLNEKEAAIERRNKELSKLKTFIKEKKYYKNFIRWKK